jgi:hypothetical protein
MTDNTRALSPLAERWSVIADSLNLQIVAPFSVQLPSGECVHADVLLMDFGAQKGMLLVTDADKVWAHRDAIISAGYGFSVLSSPDPDHLDSIELDGVLELLRDWGWAGSTDTQPTWLDPHE